MKQALLDFVKGKSKFTRPACAVGIAAGAYLCYSAQGIPLALFGGLLATVNLYGLWVSCKS